MNIFNWRYDLNSEIELPVTLAWDFCLNPSNWLVG